MMNMANENVWKFNLDSKMTLEELENTKVYKLREKIDNGESLTDAECKWLTEHCNDGGYKTSISLMGWRFCFCDILKRFLVEDMDTNHIRLVYATSEKELKYVFPSDEYDWDSLAITTLPNSLIFSSIA